MLARIGTLTAGKEWFKPWRTISGEALADASLPELRVLIADVLDGRLLDLVGHFLVFEGAGSRKLRVLVKRILRKYGYPPDKQEKATQTVLEQAEVLSEAWALA